MKTIRDYDDNCPIDDTLKLISKKWVIFIIRDMFLGKTQFSEFLEEKTLSTRVLTDTLKFMENNDLIKKEDKEYFLTRKGYNLNRILYNMLEYGLDEVNSGNLNDKQKEELKKDYQEIMKIDYE
ncbi:MAG: helix-turn-helix transcriptional regulator [Methanosphaera sp.]|nr:helix-turn-helix transcriptional regulator [Methanosphaera sp.]